MTSLARIRTGSPDPQDIHADVWHAHALADAPLQVQPTGHAELDAQLPGGGWPVGALTEILQPAGLHSEWRLLLPALARSVGIFLLKLLAKIFYLAQPLALRVFRFPRCLKFEIFCFPPSASLNSTHSFDPVSSSSLKDFMDFID